MSGPIDTIDAPANATSAGSPDPACLEISDSREARVGHFRVRRALPRRGRRTVGGWCFADHMGPAAVKENDGLDIGPHPHIGLQTVTWLIDGQVLHRDSLGTEQVIKPGQLNLMTAGHGVSHSEEATGAYRGTLHGLQLWAAQPSGTRQGPAAFEHHTELPQLDVEGAVGTVLVGNFGDQASAARCDTPLVAVDLAVHAGQGGTSTWPLRPEFEYAVVVLDGELLIQDRSVGPGRLAYVGLGREVLRAQASGPARAVLLGGEPFPEPLLMWWNFVARTREEIDAAFADWQSEQDRFGRVHSALPRIPVAAPHWQLP